MEIYSANEYWVKSASLLHTDPTGTRDLPDSPYARNYLMSSMRHGTAASPDGPGTLPAAGVPAGRQPAQLGAGAARALHRARRVGRQGKEAAESRVPKLQRRHAGAAAAAVGNGLPGIPSPLSQTSRRRVTYTGLKTTRYHFDYGPRFYETGIATINPPVIVPDSDGPCRRFVTSTGQPGERPDLPELHPEDRHAMATTSPACGSPT